MPDGSPGRYITLSKRPPQYLTVRTTLAGTVDDMEADDDGPLAGLSIDLDGHRHLFALATRKVIDQLALAPRRSRVRPGPVALDERAVAVVDALPSGSFHPLIDLASGGCVLQQRT